MYTFLPARNVSAALHFTNKYNSYLRLLEKKKNGKRIKEMPSVILVPVGKTLTDYYSAVIPACCSLGQMVSTYCSYYHS